MAELTAKEKVMIGEFLYHYDFVENEIVEQVLKGPRAGEEQRIPWVIMINENG
ncbi:hypothetical protein ACE41H_21375 [Paenibacillus enshidis]|uniref:Uncharacterized protein n=1 Tax=Paenibacillus enshidis TaxID=1458439 RepID=A0ABV5AYL9_9BACL